jgi:hypothetical protein
MLGQVQEGGTGFLSQVTQGNPVREQMVLRIGSQDRFAMHFQKAVPRLEEIRRNGARTQVKLGQDRLESNTSAM